MQMRHHRTPPRLFGWRREAATIEHDLFRSRRPLFRDHAWLADVRLLTRIIAVALGALVIDAEFAGVRKSRPRGNAGAGLGAHHARPQAFAPMRRLDDCSSGLLAAVTGRYQRSARSRSFR